MIFKKFAMLVLPALLAGITANASTLFDFDQDAPGTSTTFTDTVNGLSATFSSSVDPGGFVVYPTIFETLTGNVLGDPGPAFADNINLDVNFSLNLSAIELNFATADFITPSPFTLTAYENSVPVGSVTSTGQFLAGSPFPEGEIAFAGANFDQVVLSSPAADFAIDNVNVVSATAPEPGTFGLLIGGLLLSGISMITRRVNRGQ